MENKYLDSTLSIKERVDDLISKMTVEEKVNQLACVMVIAALDNASDKFTLHAGIGQVAIMGGMNTIMEHAQLIKEVQEKVIKSSRFGIPAIIHAEALSGPVVPNACTFPTSISLGATFEPEIVKDMGERIRKQMYTLGIRQALSPVLDVARELRWGRVSETYGMDPTLNSMMSCAFVQGIQGEDLTKGVAATAKHFLGYSQTEGGINMTKTVIDARDLREVFAKPFEAAIRKSNLKSVMNSYSELNGRPICASKTILTDLLREDLGFDGLVVSDYMSVPRLVENFHVANDIQDAAIQCLEAGLDVELPTQQGYGKELIEAVEKGLMDVKYVDISCRRSLTLKFELGLFENPYPIMENIEEVFNNAEDNIKSLEAARKVMNLTKNEGILPIKNKNAKVAVIGPTGDSLRAMYACYTSISMEEMGTGSGFEAMAGLESSNDTPDGMFSRVEHPEIIEPLIEKRYPDGMTIFEAVKEKLPNARFAKGCHTNLDTMTDIAKAVALAKDSDIVIMTLGGKNGWGMHCTSGEGVDASRIDLPGRQEELLEAVYAVNSNMIIVHTDSRPLISEFAYEHVPAILEGWLCCTYGPEAIAETLVGENNPAGRTPVDVPKANGIAPLYHYQRNASHPKTGGLNAGLYIDREGYLSRPFGYGLSYTTFEYSNISLQTSEDKVPVIQISIDITNTGNVCGEEVAQLYGSDKIGSMIRPYQELMGIKRISIKVGEKKNVKFTFSLDELAFINQDGKWVVEAGEFVFFVGSNSEDYNNKVFYTMKNTVEIDYTKRDFFAKAK
ncbi:MAG: beta-glucosidase family protein [Mobilitalea sp.]